MGWHRPYGLKRMPLPAKQHTYPVVTLALKLIVLLLASVAVAIFIVLAPIFRVPT